MGWILAGLAVVAIAAAWLTVPTTAPAGCLLGHDWTQTIGASGSHVFVTFQCTRCGRQRRFFNGLVWWHDLETGVPATQRWQDRCGTALRRHVALREMERSGA